MKTGMFVIALVLMVGLTAMSAVAQQVTIGAMKLGSDKQEAGKNVSTTFTLTNTGATNLSSINLSSTANSKFKLAFTGVPSSLAVNASATVTVTGEVAKSLDRVNGSLVPSAVLIGAVTVSASGASVPVVGGGIEMQAQNRLEVNKVVVTVNGNEDSAKDGDTVEGIKPGDKIEVEVEVENLFGDKDDDPDINDVDVKIDVDDSDFDLDETEDAGDIGPDEKESVTFDESDVDDEARDGRHKMTVTSQGRDDDGALHGESITINLEVERETHELRIKRADVSPTRITCNAVKKTVDVRASMVNIGRRDEDKAVIEAAIPELGLVDSKRNIELDRDDTVSRALLLTLSDSVKPGTYNVVVRALYEDTIETDSKTVQLTVDKCEAEAPVTTTTSQPTSTAQTNVPVTTTAPVTTPGNSVDAAPRTRVSSASDSSTGTIALLAGGVVVVLVLIGLIAYFGFKPKVPVKSDD